MIALGKHHDHVTAAERYAIATGSSDLTPRASGHCDADKLIAAGWAASDPKRAIALSLYRMAVTGNTQGLQGVVDAMDGWLNAATQRKGGRPIPKHQRRQACASILSWWLKPTCGYCEGRGFELVPSDNPEGTGARVLSGTACQACHGTGKRPLERELPSHLGKHARDITDQLDRLVVMVTGEMARMLRPELEL